MTSYYTTNCQKHSTITRLASYVPTINQLHTELAVTPWHVTMEDPDIVRFFEKSPFWARVKVQYILEGV